MICELCGYNDKEPLGRYIKDSDEDNRCIDIRLNDNGLKGMHCIKRHLSNKVIYYGNDLE